MDLFETLAEALRPEITYKDQLPNGIREYALNNYKEEMDCLYYADLYILPLTIEGEIESIDKENDNLVMNTTEGQKIIEINSAIIIDATGDGYMILAVGDKTKVPYKDVESSNKATKIYILKNNKRTD